jgi:hypothetical protein
MFPDETTLGDVRRWILDRLIPTERGRTGKLKANPGVECPACRQNVAMSVRPFDAKMARLMLAMYRGDPYGWHHTPSLTGDKGGDSVKSQHWGLIEGRDGEKADGNPRNGFWRLTELGRRFVRGEVTIPRWALLYNEERHALDGPPITIQEALGTDFNYNEIIRGA